MSRLEETFTIDISRRVMASEFRIILGATDEYYARQVAEAALDEVTRLEKVLNCFDPTSEISYVNGNAYEKNIAVSPDLFEILQLSLKLYRETCGAFDVTAGRIIDLWRSAEKSGFEPDAKTIREAAALVGMQHVTLDDKAGTVRFERRGLLINLGGIGKGYAVRKAASILKEYGIPFALISSGNSTIYALGTPPNEKNWRIGIRHPSKPAERIAVVELVDGALSTSGGPQQRDEFVAELYEHIIDPLTGEPAQSGLVSASVITQDPAIADALSTTFYLKGKAYATEYCKTHEGVKAILVEEIEKGTYTIQTGGG
jgi:thiamine biosynthesis lipoprotein